MAALGTTRPAAASGPLLLRVTAFGSPKPTLQPGLKSKRELGRIVRKRTADQSQGRVQPLSVVLVF